MEKPINLKEKFPHLSKAPIAEAVIDLKVVSCEFNDVENIESQIKSKLPDYSNIQKTTEFKYQIEPNQNPPNAENLGCVGFRLTSNDKRYIVQFNRTGLVVSRLQQYEDWNEFCCEAEKLWKLYCDIVKPSSVKRIGVRFINKMPANYEEILDLTSFFVEAPKPKQINDWYLKEYFHRDILRIPDTNYGVIVIKTVASAPGKENEVFVVLDEDVFCEKEVSSSWSDLSLHLENMHWLKNKTFFSILRKQKIKEFE